MERLKQRSSCFSPARAGQREQKTCVTVPWCPTCRRPPSGAPPSCPAATHRASPNSTGEKEPEVGPPLTSDRYQWLEVDLGERTRISAVATQGRYGSSDWLTSYLLMFSDTGHNWKQYRQEDSIGTCCQTLKLLTQKLRRFCSMVVFFLYSWKVLRSRKEYKTDTLCNVVTHCCMDGNSNADSVVQYKLQQPAIARFLRLLPLSWNPNGRIGLRLETYGCPHASDVVALDGASGLVYRWSPGARRSSKEVVSLKFKTLRNSGTLLQAAGEGGLGLSLELERGKLQLLLRTGHTDCVIEVVCCVVDPELTHGRLCSANTFRSRSNAPSQGSSLYEATLSNRAATLSGK
ncbi:unnamed protein product [Pleuronectes platessa]|uniref:F5/8 type C domain-containing protein n=1 Tax=Pleuronectes platessa TaxID=8262 RepID=A0A9N7ULP0_PLEPL|nr:unnamed protein product [Pleuronectes platessa]